MLNHLQKLCVFVCFFKVFNKNTLMSIIRIQKNSLGTLVHSLNRIARKYLYYNVQDFCFCCNNVYFKCIYITIFYSHVILPLEK